MHGDQHVGQRAGIGQGVEPALGFAALRCRMSRDRIPVYRLVKYSRAGWSGAIASPSSMENIRTWSGVDSLCVTSALSPSMIPMP